MKLWEKEFNSVIKKVRLKRRLRKFVSTNSNFSNTFKRNGRSTKPTISKIVAPTILDIYNANFHTKVVDFIEQIEIKVKHHQVGQGKIPVCFRNTTYISSAAGIFILARLENLKTNYPHVRYIVSRPPVKTSRSREPHLVDSVLNRIGIYAALGQPTKDMKENPSVRCWEVIRGEFVESEIAGKLLEAITTKLGMDYSDLYRPLIEAMSNSVEHAYREDLYVRDKSQASNKWWCFAAIMDNKLVLLICDLGVGIPKTLALTQGEGILSKIIEILGKPLTSDADHIKAALQVKRTRTKLGYRGKGGTDLQSIIDNHINSRLRIISNKGNYRYTNRKQATPEILWDGKKSIGGTIVEWSVPLPAQGNLA